MDICEMIDYLQNRGFKIREEEIKDNMKIGNHEFYMYNKGNFTYRHNNSGAINRTEIKDVIFNPPATIIKWADGTKTVVKTQGDEAYDPEKGFAMAVTKKYFGNEGNYYNEINNWVSKYKVKQVSNVVSEIKKIIENIDSYNVLDFDISYDAKYNKYIIFIGDNLGIKITYKGIYNILNSSFITWDICYDYKRMGSLLNIWPKH